MNSLSRRMPLTAGLIGLVSATMLGWTGAAATPSAGTESGLVGPRISTYSISVSPTIAKAGETVAIRVSGVFNVKSCQATLLQAGKTSRGRLAVRNYTASGQVRVPASFKGQTTARVACGKDGTATSDPFIVVSPNEPTSASCDIVEYGFGVSDTGYTNAGLRVTNASPTLSADDVEVALTYRDSSGRVVKTDTIYHYDGIPPATTVILAGSTNVSRPVSLSVASRCDTSTEDAPPVLPSRASIVASDYSLDVVGEMRNTLNRTVERFSEVNYIVRDASGSIIGGGTAYLDSFVAPGGVGTWEDYVVSSLPYTVSDGVEANVFVDFED